MHAQIFLGKQEKCDNKSVLEISRPRGPNLMQAYV